MCECVHAWLRACVATTQRNARNMSVLPRPPRPPSPAGPALPPPAPPPAPCHPSALPSPPTFACRSRSSASSSPTRTPAAAAACSHPHANQGRRTNTPPRVPLVPPLPSACLPAPRRQSRTAHQHLSPRPFAPLFPQSTGVPSTPLPSNVTRSAESRSARSAAASIPCRPPRPSKTKIPHSVCTVQGRPYFQSKL